MSLRQCFFCSHLNPHNARYCNACAAEMYLRPCPRCEAVNDRDAERCRFCQAELPPAAARPAGDSSAVSSYSTTHGEVPRVDGAVPDCGPDSAGPVMMEPLSEAALRQHGEVGRPQPERRGAEPSAAPRRPVRDDWRFGEPRWVVIVAALVIAVAGTALGGYWHSTGKAIAPPTARMPVSAAIVVPPRNVDVGDPTSVGESLAGQHGEHRGHDVAGSSDSSGDPKAAQPTPIDTPVSGDARAHDAPAARSGPAVIGACSGAMAALALCSNSHSGGN